MLDLGTVKPGATLYIPFHTFDSNDPSASVTISGLATTDIEVYKDGSVTQRASDSGYALLDTDGIDFDGTTGVHGISIDLADNTTAGFWASGSQYWVVIASITVDAATVNFTAATFRIGYDGAIVSTTIATLASQVSFTLTAGSASDDAYNGSLVLVHDVASAVEVASALISDYKGATKTVTLAADPGIFTMAATDNVAIYPAHALAVWDRALTGNTHNVVTSAGRRLRALNDFGLYEGGFVWIDTVNGVAGTTDFENGTVNNPVDSIADAITIATSINLPGFHLVPGSSITLAATMNNYELVGELWTLALGGQDIGNSLIKNATVSGIGTGTTPKFIGCSMGEVTLPPSMLIACGLTGTTAGITMGSAGDYFLHDCRSKVAGNSAPKITWDGAGTSTLGVRAHSGGIQFEGMVAGEVSSVETDGQFVEGTCSGGAVTIRGNCTTSGVTNITLTDDARIDVLQINAEVDTALSDYDGPTNAEMEARTIVSANYATAAALATVDTVVDAIKAVTDALTASAAGQLALSAAGIIGGAAEAGTLSTTVMTSDLTGYVNDELIGRTVIWTGGDADGQASDITDYASASGTVTYTAITTLPAAGDTFVIV